MVRETIRSERAANWRRRWTRGKLIGERTSGDLRWNWKSTRVGINFLLGTTLAVAGGGSASVKLWDTAEWKLIAFLSIPRPERLKPSDKSGNKKFVLSVVWSPDGKQLACGSMDGTISIFDVPPAKFLHHFMPVRSLVYSPVDARVLFSGSDNAHVHTYDAEGKSLINAMSGHASWVLIVDVSPDGAAIATGSCNKRLWDADQPFRSGLGGGVSAAPRD